MQSAPLYANQIHLVCPLWDSVIQKAYVNMDWFVDREPKGAPPPLPMNRGFRRILLLLTRLKVVKASKDNGDHMYTSCSATHSFALRSCANYKTCFPMSYPSLTCS